MKKFVLDLTIKEVKRVHERYVLLRLTDDMPLPEMLPGQFVEVRVDGSPSTFLRRPISINFLDREQNELWLLVATVGEGTRRLAQLKTGDRLNCILPLGNGFTLQGGESMQGGETALNEPSMQGGFPALKRVLLVGGGVGVAPLLYLGKILKERGTEPTFLLGARTGKDLLMLDEFRKYGRVFVTTEDGSQGEQGFVTNHSLLSNEQFDLIQTCGPTPMMKAVARYAREHNISCEASLENLMACGLGACLCCVEKASPAPSEGGESCLPSPNPSEGGEICPPSPDRFTNVCVCKEGPVFNIRRLLWN